MIADDVSHGFDEVTIAGLRARGGLKWAHHGEDVLAAWVAEMDFAIAPTVRDALRQAIESSAVGYPVTDRLSGVPQACAAWLGELFGWVVDPRQVFTVPDVVRGVALALDTFTGQGRPVVIVTPAYPPFFEVVATAGRAVIELPLTTGGAGPAVDLVAVDRALAGGAGALILCNPHNPTGRVSTGEELAALAEVVARHDCRVIADEIHAPLTYAGRRHVPYASVSPAAAEHALTLTSASKAWNLAGLKCAQIVLSGPGDAERWRRVSFVSRQGVTPLGIAATVAAFRHGDAWRRDLIGYLDANRRALVALLDEHLPGVGYEPPEATYLAWLDCRGLDLAGERPASFFLDRARVALSDGALFGTGYEGFVRLNFGTSRAILERIVNEMGRAVRGADRHPALLCSPPNFRKQGSDRDHNHSN